MKDNVSVTVDRRRIHKQNKLILCNPYEDLITLKELHPDKTISFSKFAELHPKLCVLTEASEHTLE
jgi:hypothetical protein